MNTKHKAGLSAAIIALMAGAYMPLANADQVVDLGALPGSTSVAIGNSNLAPGAGFTDQWNFQVASDAAVVDTQNSVEFVGIGAFASFSSGVELASVALYEGGTLLSNANLSVSSTPIPPLGSTDSYNSSLTYASLLAGHSYTLEIQGAVLGTQPGQYTGTLTTIASSNTPVPVPGAVWLFGSALAGLAEMARRKGAAVL